MKFNLFNIQENDFDSMLKYFGYDVYVNNKQRRALITNKEIKEYNDKFISTQEPLQRGDIVYHDGQYYIVINQVTTTRYESYKAIIRLVEHNIIFNVSKKVPSSSSYLSYFIFKAPTILSMTSDFGIDYGKFFQTTDGQMHIFVQENDITRKLLAMSDDNSKHNVLFGNFSWEILGVDSTKKGLFDITVKTGLKHIHDDKDKGIAWSFEHKSYDGSIDETMFLSATGGTPEPDPEPPASNPTNVTDIYFDTYSTSFGAETGSVNITWKADPQATDGYRLKLFYENTEKEFVEVTGLSHEFINLGSGDYYVKFESKVGNDYMTPQQSSTFTIMESWL